MLTLKWGESVNNVQTPDKNMDEVSNCHPSCTGVVVVAVLPMLCFYIVISVSRACSVYVTQSLSPRGLFEDESGQRERLSERARKAALLAWLVFSKPIALQ